MPGPNSTDVRWGRIIYTDVVRPLWYLLVLPLTPMFVDRVLTSIGSYEVVGILDNGGWVVYSGLTILVAYFRLCQMPLFFSQLALSVAQRVRAYLQND